MKIATTFKRVLSTLLVLTMLLTVPAINNMTVYADGETSPVASVEADDIVILYDNDTHCSVDGYATMAALKNETKEKTQNVVTVSCGDFIQGAPIGTLSKGEAIVEIMNEVGYDVVTLGNHEFDYSIPQLKTLMKKLNAKVVSCNFRTAKGNKPVFAGYTTKKFAGKKIAFVGITTPEAFVKSTPVYFQDSKGNYIYTFCNDLTGEKLYKRVQRNIDLARKNGADYVIAVSHLGMEGTTDIWTSEAVIKNTTGIDVMLDGHSHEEYASRMVQNKAGKDVILSQTGSKFANIGKLVIKADGTLSSELVNVESYGKTDEAVSAVINAQKATYDEVLNEVIGESKQLLTIYTPDGSARAIRNAETNLGDFCCDALKNVLGADIALMNGGGIRANIEEGQITRNDLLAVFPWNNMACVIEATGQQIKDALELGAANTPGESGGFMQVSGMKYTIDTSIPSSVVKNENGEFVKVDGAYRVSNVRVYNKTTKKYELIKLNKKYKVAGVNYELRQNGDGMTMFKGCNVIKDDVMEDCQVLVQYITENLKGVIGTTYSNPAGKGRITIK